MTTTEVSSKLQLLIRSHQLGAMLLNVHKGTSDVQELQFWKAALMFNRKVHVLEMKTRYVIIFCLCSGRYMLARVSSSALYSSK